MSSSQQLQEIVVTGTRSDKLTREVVSGSRLGLTPLETPATLDIITANTMQMRGYAQVQDAVDSMPGVSSGGSPADPTGFSMRGFTADQVTVLRNGAYLGPSNMVNRPQNSFNLADIEVLKGPASVLYGQGAVGGIVNVLSKEPRLGETSFNSLFSVGSFGTYDVGVGGNLPISPDAAIRLDISRTSSEGYVKNDNPDVLNVTATAIWNIRDDLSLKAIIDYMHDDLPSYYGTPLVPGSFSGSHAASGLISSTQGLALDSRTLYENYNVADSEHYGTYIWPTIILTWQPTDDLTVSNEAYMYVAQRKWQNAETFTFLGANSGATDGFANPIPANQIGRDRFYVYHNQHDYNDLLDASYDSDLFGLKNKTTIGMQALDIHFLRARGFPDAQYADAVDPFNPAQGSFGNFPGTFPQKLSPTNIQNIAGLFEDALDVTDALKLVVGARREWLRVDRKNFNADGSFNQGSSFTRNFQPFSYRAGLVYEILPKVTLYGEWTTAVDPPGANIFLTSASNLQSLTTSRQGEIGAKGVFLDGRADATLSLYDIHRSNILASTGPNSVANVGSEHSRGAEFSAEFKATDHWSLSANASYTFARYGVFVDPNSGVDASGHKVPDVPAVTANVWAQYSNAFDYPVDLGLGVRYIGQRAGDYANTLTLENYTIVNLYMTYHVTPNVDITGRIDNLFDKTYVQWTDVNYPTEAIIGRPRYFEASITTHF